MKLVVPLILFLFFLPWAIADNWFYNSKELIINLNITSHAVIVPTSQNYEIRYLNLNLSFYPFNDGNQKVLRMSTVPDSEMHDRYIKFKLISPTNKDLSFSIYADVKIVNSYIPAVADKVEFPIKELPQEIIEYTFPTKTIDSDNVQIIKKASELAEGVDDLFLVLYNLATWTKSNIKYDLSTLTESVSQKASWVFENKEGVCDEITSLFIAMSRTLGIPAKFITGVAYTNSELFPVGWGSHGWAEVYFPKYGWVPFDVTYGQYGYVDPTHIKLKESVDPDSPSSEYEFLGTNVALETKKTDVKADVTEKSGITNPLVEINGEVLKDITGFGSYNLVVGTVRNLANHYVSTDLYLAKSKEVEIVDSEFKSVLIKPLETKKVFWIIKLTESLNREYIYTLPIGVVTPENISSNTNFTASINERKYSLEEINANLNELLEEEKKVYSKNIELRCNLDKIELYENDSGIINCNVKNTGNVFLEGVNLCILEECEKFDIGITRIINTSRKIDGYIHGQHEIAISVKNNDVSKTSYLRLDVLDKPNVSIENLVYPDTVLFDEEFAVSFLVKKLSLSTPKNVSVDVIQNSVYKEWTINMLNEDREFILTFNGRGFTKMQNPIEIDITYEDGLGRKYSEKKDFVISLKNVTLIQRIVMLLNRVGEFILNLKK